MRTLFASSIALLFVAACSNGGGSNDGGTDGTTSDVSPNACTSDVDCVNAGAHCYFAITGGCSATGTCITYSPPATCTPNVACGCDDTTISVCAPAGYVTFPASAANACPDDGGTDASDAGNDAGAADASDAGDASPE